MRDIEQEERARHILNRYIARFGEDEVLCLYTAPPMYQDSKNLTELYERCLQEDKPASAFVDTQIDENAIY